MVQEKDGERVTLTSVAITSHRKPNITVASGCTGAKPWEQQYETNSTRTARETLPQQLWWKVTELQGQGRAQSCKWKTLGIAEGWGTKGTVQHTTFFMNKFSLKSSHILHAHKTDLPLRAVNFSSVPSTTFSRHSLDKVFFSLLG